MANSQIDWREYLDPQYCDVPLHALNYSLVRNLALYLDEDALMRNNMIPNYIGCAELAGFFNLEIGRMERAQNHTKQFFDDWKDRPDLEPTVGRFVQFLAVLGRLDILTECHQAITADVEKFLKRGEEFQKLDTPPLQVNTVTEGPGFEPPEDLPRLITRQDVINNCETYYDAFICYNPIGNSSQDLLFIQELIKRFEEGTNLKFNLFVPYRDDLPGFNNHSINAKIISERCRHMIVVLSQNFLSSPACDFQSTFAHALSPSARSKRIIPIKIQDCPTPNILKIMSCCDFTKKDLCEWSWDRLTKSIMVPLEKIDYEVCWTSSLNGMIHTTNFDLNSALESGFASIGDSPRLNRLPSPNLTQNLQQPMTSTSLVIQRQAGQRPIRANVTAPIISTQQRSTIMRTLFSNKKSKAKNAAETPQPGQ